MKFKYVLLGMNIHRTLEIRGSGGNRLFLMFQSSQSPIPAIKLVSASLERANEERYKNLVILIDFSSEFTNLSVYIPVKNNNCSLLAQNQICRLNVVHLHHYRRFPIL